jgi:hypothetical protein
MENKKNSWPGKKLNKTWHELKWEAQDRAGDDSGMSYDLLEVCIYEEEEEDGRYLQTFLESYDR